LFNDIVNRFPGTRDERNARFQKFYYAFHAQKDIKAASTILDDIKTRYSQDDAEGEIGLAESLLNPSAISAKSFGEGTKKIVVEKEQSPEEFAISQNYPNPFNPNTTISYQLPSAGIVSLKVYDMLGREVVVLVDGVKEAGYYNATFNGSDLASGIYFIRFTATPQDGSHPFIRTMKILLTK